jgi:hypothetical protein
VSDRVSAYRTVYNSSFVRLIIYINAIFFFCYFRFFGFAFLKLLLFMTAYYIYTITITMYAFSNIIFECRREADNFYSKGIVVIVIVICTVSLKYSCESRTTSRQRSCHVHSYGLKVHVMSTHVLYCTVHLNGNNP